MSSQDLHLPNHLPSILESLCAEASHKAAELQRSLDSVTHVGKTLTDLLAALLDQRVFYALDLLGKESEGLVHFLESQPQSPSILGDLGSQLDESARRAWLEYPKMLEDACHRESLPLDQKSRHPNYKFANGFLVVRVKKQGKTVIAALTINERKIAEFPADVEAVVQKVEKEKDRLFGRPYEGEKVLKTIRHHYLETVQAQQLPDGSPVEIRGLANRIVKAQRGYKLDEFIVDLSKIAREGPSKIDERCLELRTTRDDRKGMLLHNLPNFGYVGSLRFVRR